MTRFIDKITKNLFITKGKALIDHISTNPLIMFEDNQNKETKFRCRNLGEPARIVNTNE